MSTKLQRGASVSGVRSRSGGSSEMNFDDFYHIAAKTTLCNQNPLTGSFSASRNTNHAWSVVKTMRGLLTCMMKQVNKVEKVKSTLSRDDAVHEKYSSATGNTAAADNKWGHLQLDATPLYLLVLGEMTSSELHIVYTLREFVFVQNRVFYIEQSYMIPGGIVLIKWKICKSIQDYGIGERADKPNHDYPEQNSNSIGMVKSTLEVIDALDLFDYIYWCHSVLRAMLPRESFSTEMVASLSSIISRPAFNFRRK